MKKGFNILLILCAALVAISCSKTKSYTDMLKDEKKAINRLIDENDFEILKDFPEDSVFKENQFVLLDNGVYLNIIDKGSDQRAIQGKTKILYRCSIHFFMNGDTIIGNYELHIVMELYLIRPMESLAYHLLMESIQVVVCMNCHILL